jgi:tetratricopeptide (TPR) repeat protein
MKTLVLGAAILFATHALANPLPQAPQQPAPPVVPPAQQAFEAGQYDRALQLIAELRKTGGAGLPEAFLAAHVLLRQNQNDRAKKEFALLAASNDPVWRLTGESSTAAIDNNLDRAVDLAMQAVKAANEQAAQAGPAGAPPPPATKLRDSHGFYQLGLIRTRRSDWAGAAEAFDRAADLNPAFAYAHYYAGLAWSRAQRPDRVAMHFEQFLKLAPNAPERSAVMSIMKTLRGV